MMIATPIIKALWIFVGLSGCFSVLCGAWLAHLGNTLPVESYSRASTALEYQFIHTLALFICLCAYKIKPSKWLLISLLLFFVGILFFSGSLYLKSLFNFGFIGSLTPFGGLSLAAAWLFIIPASKALFR